MNNCTAIYVGRTFLSRNQTSPHDYAESVHLYELLGEATKVLLRKVLARWLRTAWRVARWSSNFSSRPTRGKMYCWSHMGRSAGQSFANFASCTTSWRYSRLKLSQETDWIITSFPAFFAAISQGNSYSEPQPFSCLKKSPIITCMWPSPLANFHNPYTCRWSTLST